MDDFNSSDIEFEPAAPKLNANAGKASIQRIIEDAASDRLTSKKRVKQLTFGHGAQFTRYKQSLWVKRFEAFREHALKQDLDRPFAMDDVIRFLDSVLKSGKLKLQRGKPGPNDDLVWDACHVLLKYGEFRWSVEDGFTITSHHRAHLETFVDDAVRRGQLIRGHWRKRTWIGFVTLSRMIRAYLAHAIDQGTLSWDQTIHRCLSIVLVSALGCRSGDVVRSQHYKGTEYMQYRHVELWLADLDGDQLPTLANVRASFTIEYEKGHKDRMNEEHVKYLQPLLDPDCHHVCPIALLLTHTLRHGLVEGGVTLQEVLSHAARRADRQIVWTHPDRPIIPSFDKGGWKLELDTPANPGQLLSTIKQMGLVAGILDRVYVHALRNGAARDEAHVPGAFGTTHAFASDDVRKSLGHSMTSGNKGLTDRYVGESSADVYSARAAAKIVHMREPAIAAQGVNVQAIVKRPIEAAELEAFADAPGSSTTLGTKQRAVRDGRRSKLRETVPKESRPSRKQAARPDEPSPLPPQKKQAASTRMPLVDLPVNVPRPRPDEEADVESPEELADVDPSNVDPALEDDDALAEAEVQPAQLDNLCRIVFPREDANALDVPDTPAEGTGPSMDAAIGSITEPNQDEAMRLVLGDSQESVVGPAGSSEDSAMRFVDLYSQYNVVRNQMLAKRWQRNDPTVSGSFEETIGPFSTRGNSRNDPTPYAYRCRATEGCSHTTRFHHEHLAHELLCDPERNRTKQLGADILEQVGTGALDDSKRKCPYAGCEWVSLNEDETVAAERLKHHITRVHKFTPKPCEHGCSPETIYDTASQYGHHIQKEHSSRFPTSCRYPDCTDPRQFQPKTLTKHLIEDHGVDKQEVTSYYPPTEQKGWVPQRCIIAGCTDERTFNRPISLSRHLVAQHSMTKEDADPYVKEHATYESKVRKPRKANAPSVRQAKKRSLEPTEEASASKVSKKAMGPE
ncbi:hypothetical protein LTR37_004875 [Vermiconidia calcicola]|uniref:Uncharacterized protein n=1 Tax=Vermiconidia calcicola TaxID=1690605 RepID=A0ACC3NLX3_9PEZI|nr:hypothetical protein LTR37_004875 [Vermiconidia calcicola]